MVACCYGGDSLELTNKGWVAFINFVADAELSISIVSHPVNLSFLCEQ